MRWIAFTSALIAASLVGAASAQASQLIAANGVISYIADQGERNDVLVNTSQTLGVAVFTFKDSDAIPITVTGGLCDVDKMGRGQCRADGIVAIYVNVRDGDDTAQVATAGENGVGPPTIFSTLIGGRGNDLLMGGFGPEVLKGNNGRDSLRGRQGADVYFGGRGVDTLQTLDGVHDTLISCGAGGRDLVRADKRDPKPKHCELGGRKPAKKF